MNVLLVDDDKEFLDAVARLLRRMFNDFNVLLTTSGKEAIKVVQNENIDLIFLDLNMPITNGIEIAKILQHTEQTKDIPIIFVTSENYEQFKKEGFELGSVDYISKPIDTNILINKITLYATILRQNLLLEHTNHKLKKKLHKAKDRNKIHEKMMIHNSKTSVMGEMIGAIAHQWRQPLNIIATSMINLETKAELGKLTLSEIQRINTKINSTLAFLSKTIDNFRNFFLLSNEKNSMNLIETIQSTIDIVKIQFTAHNINVEFTYSKDVSFEFEGFYNEIRQVVMNLLANSKDAIELKMKKVEGLDGKIAIDINKKDDKYIISICDNGGGVDEKIQSKIFNPYFSTKFAEQGTGIGLYMSKTIIEKLHEGEIRVYNKNDGACFEFKI